PGGYLSSSLKNLMNALLKVKLRSVATFKSLRSDGCCEGDPSRTASPPAGRGVDRLPGEIRMKKTLFASRHRPNAFLAVIAAFAVLHCQAVFAQSTIFNIPSTDAVAKKKVYFEFDFISHLESHDNGGFQSYVPRVVVGLGKGVEVGVNLATTSSAAPTTV